MSEQLSLVINPTSTLHQVVRRNDTLELLRLLKSLKFNVNAENMVKRTPLHEAAFSNKEKTHLDAIRLLLSNGADVNAQDSEGNTPLHYLVWGSSSPTILDLFFEHKANIDLENDKGETPLFGAVFYGNVDAVRILVERGADVNHRNLKESTALHRACFQFNCSEDMVRCLVNSRADTAARDSGGRVPLMDFFDNLGHKRELADDEKVETEILRFLLDCTDMSVNSTTGHRKGYDSFISGISLKFVWKIMLEQIAKLGALNLPIHPSFTEAILKYPCYKSYYKECEDELVKAKAAKLKNSWVSLFNLLVDDERKLKNYAGNRDLVEDFEKGEWEEKFPIYWPRIRENMKNGIETRKLYDTSAEVLSDFCPIFNPTHLIVRDILDCLKVEDYETFVR